MKSESVQAHPMGIGGGPRRSKAGQGRPRLRPSLVWMLLAIPLAGCSPGSRDSVKAPAPAQPASSPAPASGPAGPQPTGKATAGGNPGAGAPVAVSLAAAERKNLPVTVELTGSVASIRSVEVRAQVPATVRSVLVAEGQMVRQGQVLFHLDDRQEKAQLERARAQLQRDEASLSEAQRQLSRSQELFAQQFISQGALDQQRTSAESQAAAVGAARASVNAAQVALSLMTISAPQPGRLGSIAAHPGAYVSPSGPALVSISQMNPVLVAFSLPQRHLADALAALKSRGDRVTIFPGDASLGSKPAGQRADVVFVDNAVDSASGTIRVKAQLDNSSSSWWPGSYVKVQMRLRDIEAATVIPLDAIVQGARGRSVFVVDEQGRAEARAVELQASANGLAAVKGIEPGERVVVEGRQSIRNGSKVFERKASSPASGAAQAPTR